MVLPSVAVIRRPVDVADDVTLVVSPAGGDTGQQGGGKVTDRRVMMQSAFDDETVVFGPELGVDMSGLIGGEPDVPSQSSVAGLGDSGTGFGVA